MSTPITQARIAMWSGPRNISTALMRAFENRPDCVVIDEPFYAHYLKETGIEHPGREAVLKSQPTSAQDVVKQLLAPLPPGQTLQYQKQMSHHLLPTVPRDWLEGVTHCFLLRDPRAMIASYVRTRPEITLADIGIEQLSNLFFEVTEATGKPPVVVDSDDLLRDPERMLRALCRKLDIRFYPEMLRWPKGPRESDGAWAPWWYKNVERSTGFEPRPAFEGKLPPELEAIAEQATELQEKLTAYKINAESPRS